MPQVPVYSTATVAPDQIPAPYDQGVNSRMMMYAGQIGADEQSRLGGALQGAGQALTQEEVNAQAMANQVKVDAALNSQRQAQQSLTYDPDTGYLNKTGSAALDPDAQGQSLPQQYGRQLQTTIDGLSAGLANDAQRRVFGEQSAQLATQFAGGVQAHMLQQYHQFGLQTQQGTVDLAANAAKMNWSDPNQIAPQIQSAQAAVWKAGQIAGEPANLTQAKIEQTTSAIHMGVIDAALQNNNPSYALAYINANKGQMTADDLLKANGVINGDMRARVATSTAMTAMQQVQNAASPSDAARMVQITAQSESGGQETNPDGSTVTSPKGAQGVMQVMPATAANPGYGVTPAQNNSPQERQRVGQDYLVAMIKNYGGDPAKAWAAYNAGPAVVDAAVKANGANWLTAMPQETQSYVATNLAQLQKTQITATPIPSLEDVQNNIRTQLGPNADPRVLKASLQEGSRQYSAFVADRKTQGDNAVQAAQQWLIQNKGNFAALPPNLAQGVTQYAPGQYDNLQTFAKSVATPPTTTNLPLYLDAVAHPDALANMSDTDFTHFAMTQLSPADAKHLATERQNQITGQTDDSTGSLNRPALNAALNNRLSSIGINPTPAPTDLQGKQQVGSIYKFMADGIFAQQQQLGHKMSEQEINSYVDSTMAKNVSFQTTFLGMGTGTKQENMMSMKVGDIPGDSMTQLRSSFASRGVQNPTDDQLIRAYWSSKK